MMDLRRLRLLCELSRRGTIAATARALSYTPSAVSQQLAALEREAGVALLERDGRRVVLTPAARKLVVRAQRIVEELDAAAAELHTASEAVRGEILVGAFPSAAVTIVVPAARALASRHPDLQLALLEVDPNEGLQLLRSVQLDILVAYEYDHLTPLSDGGVESVHLADDPVLIAMPAHHPLAAESTVDLADLHGERWIAGLAGTPFGMLVQRACRAAGFEPRITHRAREFGVQKALVGAGLGVALLPALGRPTDSPNIRFAQVRTPTMIRHIHAMVRRGAQGRPTVRATIQELARAAT